MKKRKGGKKIEKSNLSPRIDEHIYCKSLGIVSSGHINWEFVIKTGPKRSMSRVPTFNRLEGKLSDDEKALLDLRFPRLGSPRLVFHTLYVNHRQGPEH